MNSGESVAFRHAEMDEVWPRGGDIRITGRVSGEGLDRLVAQGRVNPFARCEADVTVTDGHFDTRVSVARLVSACREVDETFDLYLTHSGSDQGRARVGRHLDDIHGKKRVFRYPEQIVDGVRVKPYFTENDNLSVTCRRAEQ
ncbi:MAG TPA: hypothetical protein VE172_15505 [Stackebrandtia sp.]|jgi:hypothetical protein|uniref:hypothetical protein n=1 Tax=Stackebrandtia sp. TaxID=2023065 RepID=UPI002D4789E7|nr:hypothetical protein [Stackebrandtia sp.]HZE40211.1 hypothetical protein [Stackebrandtia sp.]